MVFIIVLVAEAQAQVINYESRGPAPRAEVATGLTSASAMEAPSPDDRDFIMEVDDLIVLDKMQINLEKKYREIDELWQEVHRLRQYIRQKDEAQTSKEYERHLMEENKCLNSVVKLLQEDIGHLRQSTDRDHGDHRQRSELERVQRGLQPQHSTPPTHPTEATDAGELFDAHVVKHQRQEMRLRDEVCQLTVQLEEAQRNAEKLREHIQKVGRDLVKTEEIAQESSNPCDQAFTEERPSQSKQVNQELFYKMMTLEKELKTLRQSEEQARKTAELIHDSYKKMADDLQKKETEAKVLKEHLQSEVGAAQVQVAVFEEDFKHELQDRTKAASRHEEEMQRMKLQMEQLKKQLFQAKERGDRAEDMIEAMELVKKRLEVSLQKVQISLEAAQEEVQVKTTQLKQYKKQVDALKEKVAIHEEQSVSLGQEMLKVREELEKTKKEKSKPERAKSMTKRVEDFKHEHEDRTKAASRHEEEVHRLKLEMEELNKQVLYAEERRARAENMMVPMEVSLQSVQVSLEAAQEEVQVKTTQLKQYKKQVDALKEKVAGHEEQSMSLATEMFKVREELEKEKAKLEWAKSTTKILKGSAESKAVPEEKYCKLEAAYCKLETNYDRALRNIAELQEEMEQRDAAYKGLCSKLLIAVDQQSTSTPAAVTEQPIASRSNPRAHVKPLASHHPSPQTHSPSHSPSHARHPTPPSQPCHAPTLPSQPPPAGLARPQQPAISSIRPPERGPSCSKQPSERNQLPARPPSPQSRGTEQDHFASHPRHQPLIHQQGYFEEHEGDITGLAPQPEQPREVQSQAAEPFIQPGGYYPPEDPNMSREFQPQAAVPYVQQPARGNFPPGGNEPNQPQVIQSQAAMPLPQQPPRENFPQVSNEPNLPRGLQSQHSMPFTQQPSKRDFPPGSNQPLRATLPSAYVAPSQRVPAPTTCTPVAEEGCYSASPPNLMSLPEAVLDYREPQFEQQSLYPAPAQDYTPHDPHERIPPPDCGGTYFQGQQHHPQMGIPPGHIEHSGVGVVLPQSAHFSVPPQQQLSQVSPMPRPGHAHSPNRPPLYQSQTAPPPHGSGTQGQVPYPPSSRETAFSPTSQGDNDNKLIRSRIHSQLQAELVVYTVPDDHERITQSHVPFDPNMVCPTCKRQYRYGEIQRFRSHVRECK